MRGECYINNKDAHDEWGLILGETSFTALLTPAPVKGYVQNKSALMHGKQVLSGEENPPKIDERDLQLVFAIKAKNRTEFLARYASFVSELEKGTIDLRTKYQPGMVYHLLYMSCQQFTQFNGRLAKFVLKLNEPNPKNRT